MASSLGKANLLLRAFGTLKIPLIGFVRPRFVSLSEDETVVRIPLQRRTRNHLKSMYFGALSIGADLAAGWAAMDAIQTQRAQGGPRIDFVFKDVRGEFLRRPDDDVQFTCRAGQQVRDLVAAAIESGERQNLPVDVVATVPSRGEDPVARFTLTLSLRARGSTARS